MHNANTDVPRQNSPVLRTSGFVRASLRSGLRTIAMACTGVTLFMVMGQILGQ